MMADFKLKKTIKNISLILLIGVVFYFAVQFYIKNIHENRILKQIISRLEADSRAAEVLVTDVKRDDETNKTITTIKFLEYDTSGNPLKPKYFTFSGNIIQFQSLVARFDDIHIRKADRLRGKSVYLFWKVFMLDGRNTQEYEITKLNEIPEGYKIGGEATEGSPERSRGKSDFEKKIWERFWQYALDNKETRRVGIKNAEIEAPGTKFISGMLYTIKIEHDGGLRIDASPIPGILRGEKIPE